jgi:hypothetical protein
VNGVLFAPLLLALAAPAANPAGSDYDPAPLSPIPPGWAELDLRVSTPGAAVAVDSGQFCGLPCRMLLAPGEHNLRLVAPELEARDLTRSLIDGSSLLLEGGLAEETSWNAWGIVLYALGAVAILTATGLVAYDVANNVGYAQGDWTNSYAAAGVAPVGLILAIWGAVRGAGEAEPAELTETVSP